MSQLRGIVLPAPTRGVTFLQPKAAQDPSFCDWSQNFYHDNQKSKVRNGMKRYAYFSSTTPRYKGMGLWPDTSGTNKIYVVGKDGADFKIYDFTSSGSVSSIATVNYFTGSTLDVFTVYYKKNLFFFQPSNGVNTQGVRYDGSSWTAINYTHSIAPVGGCVYKSRLYLFGSQSTDLVYSEVNSVSGTTGSFPLDRVFSSGNRISWITTFSLSDTVTNDVYLAIGNDAGEVLVYSGDNPESLNWNLQGRFVIGPPIYTAGYLYNYTQVIDYQGDSLIITSTGLVSLRDLFTQGSSGGGNKTISSEIDDYWIRLVAGQKSVGLTQQWGGCFYPDKKRIVIFTHGFIERDGSLSQNKSCFFVFNTQTLGWSLYSQSNDSSYIPKMVYANNMLYFAHGLVSSVGQCIYEFESKNYWKDDQASDGTSGTYEFELDGAWNSFGDQLSSKKVIGFQPIINTDFATSASQFGMRVAVDMGRVVSGLAEVPAPNNSYSKRGYGVGDEGTFFQWRLEGDSTSTSSPTTGLELYSVNALFEQGDLKL